jgi:hypothetical protein
LEEEINIVISVIEAENQIKEQLKYITNDHEKAAMPDINRDSLRVCVKNEELFYRALNK